MKKIIAILLVLVMIFSFAACKKGPTNPPETLPLDVEVLKADWTKGELVFPEDKKVAIPCTLNEFTEKSEATINAQDMFEGKILEPKETLRVNITVAGANMELIIRNTTEEPRSYSDSFVIGYNYNNTNEANRQIKFAGTLSPGVVRADVEESMGIPKDRTQEDTLYIYEGRNTKNRRIKLSIAFDSYDVVNSVSYELVYSS